MQRFTLTLAEVPISATVQFPSTREYCAEWETPEATPVEHVTISEQDIAAEREPHTPPQSSRSLQQFVSGNFGFIPGHSTMHGRP